MVIDRPRLASRATSHFLISPDRVGAWDRRTDAKEYGQPKSLGAKTFVPTPHQTGEARRLQIWVKDKRC
jgi:hypothetical protein